MSEYLNLRGKYLEADFVSAISPNPYYYDTDLENFWTQKSKMILQSDLYFIFAIDF